MHRYEPPLEDYRFLLERVLRFDDAMAELGRDDVDLDLAMTVLGEAGKMCVERLQPLNSIGDQVGCRLVAGEVVTPPGFADAYRAFVESGWASLSGDLKDGGQGLPFLVQLWFDEMVAANNMSFGLFAGLTRGATEALAAHGSDALKAIFLTPMTEGRWTGAMALTESGAGSDLALLTTRAISKGDDTYAITGTKIFISSGDHDFGGNVVHLVLARVADAPAGVGGISLFLVPKFLPAADGTPGSRNSLSVGSLESKMGIHAQPTCVMNYEGATGWLIGEPNRGLAAMFTMMNAERLMVGIQGLGVAGGAYQQATAYARQRLQGAGTDGAAGPVPIIAHPDVRRMLMEVRVFVESARALAGWVALHFDRARAHPDASERVRSDGFVALLTPVVKAAFTDMGFEAAVQAQQVFGGHGYVREWGMEQFVRDVRIAQIYEGTNGIQAMDLVGRKLGLGGGAVVDAFLDLVEAELADAMAAGGAAAPIEAARDALGLLREATALMRRGPLAARGAAAVDYLRFFSLVALGWMWARMTAGATGTPQEDSKLACARFYAERVLPRTTALFAAISAGGGSVAALHADQF